MSNVFLVSDTHWGHRKMYEQPFLGGDGTPLRPWTTAEEADEFMVQRWNAVVRPTDKVYHLGDVAIPRSGVSTMERLSGDKVLIAGNHDSVWMPLLQKHFRAIRSSWVLDNFVLTHVPIHPGSLRKHQGNIHGHLHGGRVLLEDGSIDKRYFCVCMEHIDYTPIAFEDVIKRFKEQQ